MFNDLIGVIKNIYREEKEIPLHRPIIDVTDEDSLLSTLRSGYVSSIGKEVENFELEIEKFTSAKHAIAVSSGSSALHVALHAIGVSHDDLVITQSLSFAATVHSILQAGAKPIYIDISKEHWSLCPLALESWLSDNTFFDGDTLKEKKTKKKISACLPMHTFGIPADILAIKSICSKYRIPLIEDAAEALGSKFLDKHCGTFGDLGIISFNGNKIITSGAGGVVLTDSDDLAKKIRHLSTTAKIPHKYEFVHDEPGFNYRMSNLNASLGLSQLKKIDTYLRKKLEVHDEYEKFSDKENILLISSPPKTKSNYWLNTILLSSKDEKEKLIKLCIENNIHVRPAWKPLHTQPHMLSPVATKLKNTIFLYDHAVCLPSSVPLKLSVS